jgi:hypothetical protein
LGLRLSVEGVGFRVFVQSNSKFGFTVNTVRLRCRLKSVTFLLLKSNLGVTLQSSERLIKKCSQSSSAATLAAMLNTYYKTVFERSFARLRAQADGTGESMMFFLGEPILTNFGCSEAHRQSPLYVVNYTSSTVKTTPYTL